MDVYQQMSPKEARALGKDIWHIFLDKTAVSVASHVPHNSCCADTCPQWGMGGAAPGKGDAVLSTVEHAEVPVSGQPCVFCPSCSP